MEYKGKQYQKMPEYSEFSCDGCTFHKQGMKVRNVGLKTRPEYKEMPMGQFGCIAPNEEPFRSCKHEHIIYIQV